MVGIGKAVGGGLPLGVYGMTAELKDAFERGASVTGRQGELATGGTMFGNALSMAAARAVLTEVLTAEAYARAAALGALLADGLEAAVTTAGLPWKVQRLGPRSGISFSGRLARNAAEADADEQPELNALLRLYLANRGVWEAISTAGPAMSVDATRTTSGPISRRSTSSSPRSLHTPDAPVRALARPARDRGSGRAHVQLVERLDVLGHGLLAPRTRARRSCGRDAC